MNTASTEALARQVLSHEDAERMLQDEFTSARTLFHFARAVAEGHAKILNR